MLCHKDHIHIEAISCMKVLTYEILHQGYIGFHLTLNSCIALKMFPLHSWFLKNPSFSHKKRLGYLPSNEKNTQFFHPKKQVT